LPQGDHPAINFHTIDGSQSIDVVLVFSDLVDEYHQHSSPLIKAIDPHEESAATPPIQWIQTGSSPVYYDILQKAPRRMISIANTARDKSTIGSGNG
jgi:hypothetical protein